MCIEQYMLEDKCLIRKIRVFGGLDGWHTEKINENATLKRKEEKNSLTKYKLIMIKLKEKRRKNSIKKVI